MKNKEVNGLKKKRLVSMVTIFLVLMLLFTGLSRAADAAGIANVSVGRPQNMMISHEVRGTGKVQQNQECAVVTEADQRVTSILVNEGEQVEKGDVLFEVDTKLLDEKILYQKQEMKKLELQKGDADSQKSVRAQQKANEQAQAAENSALASGRAGTALSHAKSNLSDAKKALSDYRKKAGVSQEESAAEEELTKICEERAEDYIEAQQVLKTLEWRIEKAVDDALTLAKQGISAGLTANNSVKTQAAEDIIIEDMENEPQMPVAESFSSGVESANTEAEAYSDIQDITINEVMPIGDDSGSLADSLTGAGSEMNSSTDILAGITPQTNSSANGLEGTAPETDGSANSLAGIVPETDSSINDFVGVIPETDSGANDVAGSPEINSGTGNSAEMNTETDDTSGNLIEIDPEDNHLTGVNNVTDPAGSGQGGSNSEIEGTENNGSDTYPEEQDIILDEIVSSTESGMGTDLLTEGNSNGKKETEKESQSPGSEQTFTPPTQEKLEEIEKKVRDSYASQLETARKNVSDTLAAKQKAEQALAVYQQEAMAARKTKNAEEEQQLILAVKSAQEAYENAAIAANEAAVTGNRGIQTAGIPDASDSTADIYELTYEQMELALSKLEELKKQNGKVKAPVDGIVTKINITAGEKTVDGTAVLLADLGKGLRFTAQITQDQEKYVGRGDLVTLKSGDGKTTLEELAVDSVTDDMENEGVCLITVQVPENTLEMGESATLTLVKKSEVYPVCVPLSALHLDERNQAYVLIAQEVQSILGTERVAYKVPVTVAEKNETYAALVQGGISSDQEIIVSSDKALSEGSRVRLKE
ncbi:MAG: HlyD family efflux transporter periplasmic adaptor subunit [Lachnospiraceae bacterium]|nr:HlyD family efflux transporter periplasmic adaptor subunit [Lachnospiraceae bacterium]